MPLIHQPYKPSLFFRNGHVHTIYPALFRKPQPVKWQRQRLELADGDFLDLDWMPTDSERLIVLGHGLEGSSNSTYILAAAHLFAANGFAVLAWNHRSCSGEMNRLPRFYHHGVTEDLAAVLAQTSRFAEVHYVGYSLGGNVLLKYLGEMLHQKPNNLKSAVAISAPIDLVSCVHEIHRRRNRLYHNRFLKTLKQKVAEKARRMPEQLSAAHLPLVKTLTDFDTFYTAPLHGFASAADYHIRASSKPFLPNIKLPTLLLQAQDDPMLGIGCFPIREAQENPNLHLLLTKYGGHVAFTQPGSRWHWMEKVALEFAMRHSTA
jgi:predicted alpha/beta-fold hydrolase